MLTPDMVRAACAKMGITVEEPSPRTDPYRSKLRTGYMDGDIQRRRTAQFSANLPWMVGMALRGVSVKVIAAGSMCTEEAVYKRLRWFSVSTRREPIDRGGPQEEIEVIEIYDD